jgi:C-5 cytosine-specific DNA methylase
VLAKHWPGLPNLGDIKTVDWTTIERPDLICAGYPCQPFSTAGRMAGSADSRHLWPYIARALGVLRPATHSWRTSQLTLALDSMKSSLTLPPSGSMRSGALYQRARWVHLRSGPDCSWWPTAKAQNDSGGVGYQQSRQAGNTTARWPTLTGAVRIEAGREMQAPGLLNPTWSAWLMGFPIDWCDLPSMPSETPPSQASQSGSAGGSWPHDEDATCPG